MKMKCLVRSIIRGDLVKPGTILDLSKEECNLDRVKAHFVAVGGTESEEAKASPAPAAAAAPAAPVVAGLNRDQAIMKLRQAGAKFKGNISNKDLAALYDQTFSNIAEATEK